MTDGSDAGTEHDAGAERDVERESDGVTDSTGRVERAGGVEARYYETDRERVLAFEGRDGATAVVAQNREGYGMLKVRSVPDGDELERYYGFDVALDHAAELLGVAVGDLPVPADARDMGM